MVTASTAQTFHDSVAHQPKENTKQKLSFLRTLIPTWKPQRGEGRGSSLEWIDTVLGWTAFACLIIPLFATPTLYMWRDNAGNPFPVPGTVSMVTDAVDTDTSKAHTSVTSNAPVASLDGSGLTYWLRMFSFGCAMLMSTAGFVFARKLWRARNEESDLEPEEEIKNKYRFMPVAIAICGLAPWLYFVFGAHEAKFEQGPVLYVADTGLVAAVLWLGIRFVRMRVKTTLTEKA